MSKRDLIIIAFLSTLAGFALCVLALHTAQAIARASLRIEAQP